MSVSYTKSYFSALFNTCYSHLALAFCKYLPLLSLKTMKTLILSTKNHFQKLLNHFQRLPNYFQRLTNRFQRLLSHFQRLLNSFQKLPNHFQRLSNRFQRLLNSFQRLLNSFQTTVRGFQRPLFEFLFPFVHALLMENGISVCGIFLLPHFFRFCLSAIQPALDSSFIFLSTFFYNQRQKISFATIFKNA